MSDLEIIIRALRRMCARGDDIGELAGILADAIESEAIDVHEAESNLHSKIINDIGT